MKKLLKKIFSFGFENQQQDKELIPGVFNIYRQVEAHIQGNPDVTGNANIWELMEKELNVQLKKPKRKEDSKYEVVEKRNKNKVTSYLIKDLDHNIYLSLNEEEFFVWNLLDGNLNLKEICNAYFNRYRKLSIMPFKLIEVLEKKNMLTVRSWNIYDTVHGIQRVGVWEKVKKVYSFFLNTRLALKNIDSSLTFFYKKFAWIFLRNEAIYLYLAIITAGLFVFFTMGYFESRYTLKNFLTTKFSVGILILFSLLPVAFHELSHAFYCKKYGRAVNKAGLMIYIGTLLSKTICN